jgi:nitroimidazol reductase NimA-like FMN-containing flavoprotein (pyridoxamine 5'-phosphate oxidase superfamily)
MSRRHGAPSARTRVKRGHERAEYDRSTIDAILDAALVCHLGFERDGQPYVIPTLHARIGDLLYVHGSSASRAVRALGEGIPACVTVTLLDGIVLARSVFEHSLNYRSVVVLGTATPVTDPGEKNTVLEAFTEKLLPGRWTDARQPSRQELKATGVLSLPIDEASAKVRTGAPDDGESADAQLDVWAGHIPLILRARPPVPAPGLRPGIPVPAYARRYRRSGLTA